MNETFAQSVTSSPLWPSDRAAAYFAFVPRSHEIGDAARPTFRLDISTSLQGHRSVALSFVLVGLFLALLSLLNCWSILTIESVNHLQPAMNSHVNAAMDGFQRSIGAIPGVTKFAASALAPWHSTDSALIRDAIVLLISLAFLGAAVAVIAHKVDPRVYIASDVERLLGFAPLAQLPDFSEVANEIAEKYLLRLASEIDRSFINSGSSRCVFTGTGHGVGVTTIATRVEMLLGAMGRAALIGESAKTSASQLRARHHGTDPAAEFRPAPMQLVDEAESIPGEMALVDAGPLADRDEAQQLVRSSNCTIVVIESGVTTRAQLRAVANILQRIKAPAVGFVLNRVRLAKADPAFRRSLREMGRQLRKQGTASDWQMLRTLKQAIEDGRAALDLDGAAIANHPAASSQEKLATDAAPTEKILQAAQESAYQPEPALLPAQGGRRLLAPPPPVLPNQLNEHTPLPPVQVASHFDRAVSEPKAACDENQQAANDRTTSNGTEHEPANPAPEKAAHILLPRLSELRGMSFTEALRELDLARRSAPTSAGTEALMRVIAPFEPMFSRDLSGPLQNLDSSQAPHPEFELHAAVRTLIPVPESGVTPEGKGGSDAKDVGAETSSLHSGTLPANPLASAKGLPRRADENEGSRPEQTGTRQKSRSLLDQLQILPSRRGQYKKKV